MKRFFIFLIVLAVILGGALYWWRTNSNRIITEQVQRIAQNFFVNPTNLSVTPEKIDVKVTGLREANVPKLVISGNNLDLRGGPTLAYAKLALNDVGISGPPFHIEKLGSGTFMIKASDQEITKFLRKRGGSVAGVNFIPLDTVKVEFLQSKEANTRVTVDAVDPIFKKRIPVTATGSLVPSSTLGQVDFRVESVKISKLTLGTNVVRKGLRVVNPVVDLTSWPVECDVKSITTEKGIVVMQGAVTGVSPSLLP